MSDPLPLVAALASVPPDSPDADLVEALSDLSARLDAMEAGRNPEYRRLLTLVEMIEEELDLDHWRRCGY